MIKAISGRFSVLSKRQKALWIGVPLWIGLVVYGPSNQDANRKIVELSLAENPIIESVIQDKIADKSAETTPPDFEYKIQKGDTLSEIFARLGFAYSDLMQIMEADLNVLALDTLHPGIDLTFWQDAEGHVQSMAVQMSLVEKVLFNRSDDGSYQTDEVKIPGTWRSFSRVGTINGSFSQSVNRAGLNSGEIDQIVRLFKEKLNFAKDIRAGDRFEIVQSKQFVGEEDSGVSELQAIKIMTHGQEITAYLHSDGQYYDKDGQSLQRAFQRIPLLRNARITSGYNPNRLHPVTGKVSPHNGTDFGIPTGTPVVAIGDGEVVMVRNHPYAGNYVVVKHDNTYSTRYLHLSKFLVKKGQRVLKGQKLGLSGATGRVTGPHLHFELLVRNRPVNAMSAKIPMATAVPRNEMAQFVANRNKLDKQLEQEEMSLAANGDQNDSQG